MATLPAIAAMILALGCASAGLAQDTSNPVGRHTTGKKTKCSPEPQMRQFWVVAIGMPYSGKRVRTCEEALPSGQQVRGKKTSYEFRDSEGRTRYEDPDDFPPGSRNVTIIDPVKHIEWSFSIGEGVDKTAIWWKYDPHVDSRVYPTTYRTLPGGSDNRRILARPLMTEGPGFRYDELTSTYVNGVWCEGNRDVRRAAPGQMNNKTDHEQIVVTEEWWSEDLFVQVRRKLDDPGLGKYRTELMNINRSEPDPTLFRPPRGYRMLESKPARKP